MAAVLRGKGRSYLSRKKKKMCLIAFGLTMILISHVIHLRLLCLDQMY